MTSGTWKNKIGFGNTEGNFGVNNELRIIIFPLPKLSEGKEVTLKASDAIDCNTLQQFVEDGHKYDRAVREYCWEW